VLIADDEAVLRAALADLVRSDVDSDARRRALATALIMFAEEMDIAVVAEGIETELEHAALQALGVRFGQGYFIGRPEPLSD
jgi:EAL domain-containing protein (putative c-di-GMP-specific phosphodiesterase class I)